MKKFSEVISEGIQNSDVHSDLELLGKHKDQHGGYHLYSPEKPIHLGAFTATMAKHGFKRLTHYRQGGKMGPDTHVYERTPAPYHTETVHATIQIGDGKVKHIHRSLQRG